VTGWFRTRTFVFAAFAACAAAVPVPVMAAEQATAGVTPALTSVDLFDQSAVRDIRITMKAEDWATLKARFQEDTAKEIERRQNANVAKIGQKMQPLIQEFAREKNLSSVIVWSPQMYAYVDESLNLTDEIVRRYDVKYPVAASSTAPPAKPKS
jgi:hypothetical protein